jgi:hypothetical protein
MLRASGFRIDAVRAVAFTSPSSDFSPSALLASVMSAADGTNVFDGEISVFPFPPEAPAVIPRIHLESKDKHWRLHASKATIDVSWSSQDKSNEIPSDATVTCSQILLNCFRPKQVAVLKRLALVITRAIPAENPAQELIDRFCSSEFADPDRPLLRNSKAFELHNLKSYNLSTYRINSWVRCKTGRYKDKAKTPVVGFEQDVNIAEDQEGPVQIEDITPFFSAAQGEADKILHLYFPD